jgi:hypothetical protein
VKILTQPSVSSKQQCGENQRLRSIENPRTISLTTNVSGMATFRRVTNQSSAECERRLGSHDA